MIVLTYRAPVAMVRRCVDAVLADRDDVTVIVVDNGGAVTADALPAGVRLLTTGSNLGYAGGMNTGIAAALEAGSDRIALLNDDTLVTAGWLDALETALDSDPTIGAAQPKLLLGDGTTTGSPLMQSLGVRVRRDGAGIDIGYGEPDTDDTTVAPIEHFSGAAVLMRRQFVVDVGGFDERFECYYEDIDLSRRGRATGWRYVVVPTSVVYHQMSATSRSMPDQRRYWQERNRLWLLARWGGPLDIGCGLARSAARLLRHPTRPQWRAIVDGVRGAPQRLAERRRGDAPTRRFTTTVDDRR